MEENIVKPLNPYKDGTCRTIKAQYQQSSRANFARQDGLGATGVVQIGNIVDDSNIGFKNPQRGRVDSAAGLSPCLNCCEGGGLEPKIQSHYRIRKLTPRECFRLMDVDENVIDTIQAAGISNSQQYKLAGNSIVVACLEKIFEQIFFPQYTNSRTLFG
jgi:DNA (cytosine-5)-methyltransferase 1